MARPRKIPGAAPAPAPAPAPVPVQDQLPVVESEAAPATAAIEPVQDQVPAGSDEPKQKGWKLTENGWDWL